MDETILTAIQEEVLKVIRKLRKERRYSLADVAIGIGYGTAKGYYDLESGKTDIKLEHLIKLSNFYKVPMGFFLNDDSTNLVHEKQKYLKTQAS